MLHYFLGDWHIDAVLHGVLRQLVRPLAADGTLELRPLSLLMLLCMVVDKGGVGPQLLVAELAVGVGGHLSNGSAKKTPPF